MDNQKINTDQVLGTIAKTVEELDTAIQPGKFTASEKEEILVELEKVEIQAYKAKLGLRLDQLKAADPSMPTRDILILMLASLPPDLSAVVLVEITKYIGRQWEMRAVKLAA